MFCYKFLTLKCYRLHQAFESLAVFNRSFALQLENAEAKLKDFSLESNAVTNWIERTEKVVKQYQQANDPTEIKRLEQQLMVGRFRTFGDLFP